MAPASPGSLTPAERRARRNRPARHPRIAKRVADISAASEEILASILGTMICEADADRVASFAKALAELLDRGQSAESANRQLQQLWDVLEALL